MPDSVLIFKLRSRCSSVELVQPYLHEPTRIMVDSFYALLTRSQTVSTSNGNSLIIILHITSCPRQQYDHEVCLFPTFITHQCAILFWYSRENEKI